MQHYRICVVLILFLGCFLSAGAFAEPLPSCKDEDPHWRSCKSAKDCVLVSNPCGWPSDAANQNFAVKAEKCNRHRGAAMSCAAYDALRDGSHTAHCIVGKCVAVKDIP